MILTNCNCLKPPAPPGQNQRHGALPRGRRAAPGRGRPGCPGRRGAGAGARGGNGGRGHGAAGARGERREDHGDRDLGERGGRDQRG